MGRKKLIERRKHKRFRVQDGAFAVLGPNNTTLGQIMDMSMGGLAFNYIAYGEQLNRSVELNILLAGSGVYLGKLEFKTVSDLAIANKSPFTSIKMRRRGLQFGKLTDHQISQLEFFIKNHAKSECQ